MDLYFSLTFAYTMVNIQQMRYRVIRNNKLRKPEKKGRTESITYSKDDIK